MTDIEQKALALLNEVSIEKCEEVNLAPHKTLCAALRLSVLEHEDTKQELADFKQKVSDAVENLLGEYSHSFLREHLHQFIIPAKPDPLEEVLQEIDHAAMWVDECAKEIRAALEARGLEIREKGK